MFGGGLEEEENFWRFKWLAIIKMQTKKLTELVRKPTQSALAKCTTFS